MARTKQTARMGTGGRVPSQIRASISTTSYRAYLTGQQAASHTAPNKKTSFLNYENIFYSFAFDVGALEQTETFTPRYFVASTISTPRLGEEAQPSTGDAPATPRPPPEREYWLGLSTVSKYDGEGMRRHPRLPLDLGVALDISGSMDDCFDSENESQRSKLAVAKEGLNAIVAQLVPGDQFGLVVFDHNQREILPMTAWEDVDKDVLRQKIKDLRICGGTDLSGGMRAATKLFGPTSSRKPKAEGRTRRILFLTDLNSSSNTANDERMLLDITAKNAAELPGGIYTTVVGVGMDFNVALVEKVSKTRGCRYTSIASVGEFRQLTEAEFNHDVMPIAFDIRLIIESGAWSVDKAYGSPELSGINSGEDDKITFSSEFPSAHDDDGNSRGGLILFRLKPTNDAITRKSDKGKGKQKDVGGNPDLLKLKMTYMDVSGEKRENTQEVHLLPTANPHGVATVLLDDGNWYHGTAVRKAIALVDFIDLHNDYIMDDRNFVNPVPTSTPSWMAPKAGTAMTPSATLVNRLKRHQHNAERFAALRVRFSDEIESCGDKSLRSSNQGYLEIIDKIIELETAEANKIIAATAGADNKTDKRGTKRKVGKAGSASTAMENIRAEVTCVICLDILSDPVQLSKCLHSFCRACLTESVRKSGNPPEAPVTCPTCKTLTPSSAVRSNFVLKNIVESLTSQGDVSQKDDDNGDEHETGDKELHAERSGAAKKARKGKSATEGKSATATEGDDAGSGSSSPKAEGNANRSGRAGGGVGGQTPSPRRSTRSSKTPQSK